MKPSAILLLLAGAVGISFAQVQQPANLPPHQIHSNDLVGISIYGEPDLNRTVRVDSDGAIRLPLLDRKVKAGGLMPDELEKAIAEAFKAEQILVNPFITVTVAEYHTLLPISVAGTPSAIRLLSNPPPTCPCSKLLPTPVDLPLKPALKSSSPAHRRTPRNPH